MCVVEGNWSAFEHTVTPLGSGAVCSSFLSLVPWKNGNDASARELHLNSVPDIENQCYHMPEKTSVCSNDISSRGSQLFYMSTSTDGISGINPGVRHPSSTASCIGNVQLVGSNSPDAINVTSAPRMISDVSCETVGSRQIISVGHNVMDSQIAPSKPARGKENKRPLGSSTGLPRLSARKCSDSGNQTASISTHSTAGGQGLQHTRHQGGPDSLNEWRSPLRLSVNNVKKNVCPTQSQLFQTHREHTNSNEALAALSFVSNDSFNSFVDLPHSPSKLPNDGSGARSDGAQKRGSSTPVKDRNLHEPIRFRRRQHSSGSDEVGANDSQRKSSAAEVSANDVRRKSLAAEVGADDQQSKSLVCANDQQRKSSAAEVICLNDWQRKSLASEVSAPVIQLSDHQRKSSVAELSARVTRLNEQSSATPTDLRRVAESGKKNLS